ncbi:putative cytokinetic ring protein SteA [soil metagenome]
MAQTQRARAGEPSAVVSGPVRTGRRTKDLVKVLKAGEVAVIDHADIDRVAADGLIESGAVAVVNASESISGRYPNGGPIRIVRAGIVLVDQAGLAVFEELDDGDHVVIDGGQVLRAGRPVAEGKALTAAVIENRMATARAQIGAELERFAVNTLEYVQHEARQIFEPLAVPPLRTSFVGRHALVVVRGHDYREDLRMLMSYLREYKPVLIGVDGGADALVERGFMPDIILGDFDSVSESTMALGAELVHHVHPDGRAPGREELAGFGHAYHEFVVEGTSEDAAMLMAYEAGARLIVAVGTHATMVEFLDKGRPGMASTFLTRLRLGAMLVDAKGVTRLYEGRVRRSDLLLLIGAALAAMLVVAVVSEPAQVILDGVWLTLRDLWYSMAERF